MLSDASSPQAYLDQLDDDWRRDTLLEIRALIKTQAPQLEEHIHYKMLGYGVGDDWVFHLNAQRGYVSLYVGDISKIDDTGALLKGLSLGKGCIRFSKSKTVSATRLDEFIQRAVELWSAGDDVGC